MLKPSLLTLFLIFLFGAASLQAEPTATIREFRPLMAKKVAVELASHVADVDSFRSLAWKHFDSREWVQAVDKFLTVLDKDPASVSAAEGLAMSLYRSGDYASAYRLGSELSELMPEIRAVVSEAVAADVRYMLKEGEFDTAKRFLSNFPVSNNHYTKAHAILSDATLISSNLGAGDRLIPAPETTGKVGE